MLELRGIRASYGETVVLRDVDLAVPETGIVALIGPNGAGKTTLLRVDSGLLSPDAGQVLLDGEDVTGWPPHRLAALGMCHVPEGRGIYRSLTVEENLRLQARPGTEEEAMQRAAEAFPALLERRAQPAGTLSGGEQQMLALTRAYLRRPRLILLDEVSMGLAPRIVDEIFAFLSRLAAEGTALLLVEQYVTRALAMADFVFLLNRGHVRFAGEPSEVADEDVFARYLGTTV
jgi:branched-chain amino acid transport system ATP-binding protein